jgi:hypothetical protein
MAQTKKAGELAVGDAIYMGRRPMVVQRVTPLGEGLREVWYRVPSAGGLPMRRVYRVDEDVSVEPEARPAWACEEQP